MNIKTDNKWKQFKYRNEVPEKVLKNYFDYQDEEDCLDGFLKYRGRWYHLDGFMRLDEHAPFPKSWTGYSSDSAFSGILIEISNDCEEYRVGTYIS